MKLVLIAFFLSFFINLCVLFLSQKFHIFIDLDTSDKPQRFHTLPTPRAGGIGIFVSFFLCFLISYFINPTSFVLGLLVGGGIIFLSGILEDFHASLSPKLRLLIQTLGAGSFVLISGSYLSHLGLGITLPFYLGFPFSIFALVGIINAINIIDGFNGLASGVTLIALGCIYFLLPSSFALSDSTLILIACILGFFIFNFPFGKIFLGDGGAYFLGFILSGTLIYLTQAPSTASLNISPWFGIALLIYPFWEVIFSIYRKKFKRHISPMQPDKLHLHMLFYRRITHHNSQTSLIILLSIAPFMISASLISNHPSLLISVSAIFILSYTYIYYTLTKFGKQNSIVVLSEKD